MLQYCYVTFFLLPSFNINVIIIIVIIISFIISFARSCLEKKKKNDVHLSPGRESRKKKKDTRETRSRYFVGIEGKGEGKKKRKKKEKRNETQRKVASIFQVNARFSTLVPTNGINNAIRPFGGWSSNKGPVPRLRGGGSVGCERGGFSIDS